MMVMEEMFNGTRDKESLSLDSETSLNSTSSSSELRHMSWHPRRLAFRHYSSAAETIMNSQHLRVSVRKPLVARLTKDIVEVYQICNSQFRYSEESIPKVFLTSPSVGVLNDGYDNANSDLILSVNYSLVNSQKNQRYIVKGMLGHGTFGQVAKCRVMETKTFVAVKIIKNSPAYYQQALVEVGLLTSLNKRFDPEDKHHIVRIYDYFVFKGHLCIVFEHLYINLYELIKLNNFRGLSLSVVQLFSKQILSGLCLMKHAGIIHCDLKPENILLCSSLKPTEIKIIDFGSACTDDHTIYSYIQSRYYRSPEVLLGYRYTTAIDMWSFGCIVAELILGLPLFPGSSEFDLLRRMIKILGSQPPDYVLRDAKNTSKFFKLIGSTNYEETDMKHGSSSCLFRALTEEEFTARESAKPLIGKEYFNNMSLREIVMKYPYRKNLADEENAKERHTGLALIDFLRGLLEFDPAKRWSPLQASKHPFVTGEPFTHPYEPAELPPPMPIHQNVKVFHHPAAGHWFAAGLSPNVSSMNRSWRHSSPHYQITSQVHHGSYGSLGSHGSYNENMALGSSYESYADAHNFDAFYSPAGPSSMNFYGQSGIPVVGSSPDTWRVKNFSHGNGIGFSPGNLGNMPLGSSPSQFTPPSSFSQFSVGSPRQYGPPSPVRGSCQGSPLGKMSSGSQYNKRVNWAYNPNFQSQDPIPSSSCQGQLDELKSYPSEANTSMLADSPSQGQWNTIPSSRRAHLGGRGMTSSSLSSKMQGFRGSISEKLEGSNLLPDPGDWDPNYSEESLLQEDNAEVSLMTSEFMKGMHLSKSLTNGSLGIAARPSLFSDAYASKQRYDGNEAGGSAENHGYSHMANKSHFTHINSASTSHLGQQPRHNLGRTALFRDGRRGGQHFSNGPAFHGRQGYC